MTKSEQDMTLNALPAAIRQRIDEAISDASVALKLFVAKRLADPAMVASHRVTKAGRIGLKSGQVSELTLIAPLKQGGAERLKKFFALIDQNLQGAGQVGTLHNMRFVFLENETKLLFATAYDGEWDPYIDDFATLIPEMMDYIFGNIEGWPGIRSPDVKAFIERYQIPAAAWFVADPDITVAEADRLRRQDKAVRNFLGNLN